MRPYAFWHLRVSLDYSLIVPHDDTDRYYNLSRQTDIFTCVKKTNLLLLLTK